MAPQTLKELKKAAGGPSASSSSSSASLGSAVSTLTASYARSTPAKVKLIDGFLLFLALSGVAQMAYYAGVTTFPYNAFLGGFASTAGQFVLLASLRAQVVGNIAAAASSSSSPAPPAGASSKGAAAVDSVPESDFGVLSSQRAFGEFCVASVVLHFFAFNFLG